MKKFSKDLRDEILKGITEHKGIIKEVSEDNGTFEVIMTAQTKDRDGDIVLQEGLDTTHFEKNSVVLWAHNYAELPIGVVTNIQKNDDGTTIANGTFASEEMNEKAQQVRKLYDAGILKTVSIGFIAKEWEGNVITESELLELSFVPVPSNREAIDIAKEVGLEKELKSFLTEVKVTDEEREEKESVEKIVKEQSIKIEKLSKTVSELVEATTQIANSLREKASEGKSAVVKEVKDDTQMIARLISKVNNNLKK